MKSQIVGAPVLSISMGVGLAAYGRAETLTSLNRSDRTPSSRIRPAPCSLI